jgi:Tol biopolymer transport system component
MFAFLSSRDEEMNIYVQPMDDGGGGAAKQITRSKTDQWSPAWFPDNRHLAYSSDQNGIYQIYVVNIESGEATQITFGDADSEYPVVSPDGSQIAFVSEKNEANIFSLDLNDQTETAQTSNVNLQLFPDISPDGRRLAFHTTRSRLFSSELKIKSLDAPLDEPTVVAKGGHARLSPDGRTLAFVRFDDKALNIWRVDADGRNEKRLTGEGILPGAYAEIPYEFFTTYFSWSPDGGRIAYVSTKSGQPNVWTIAADGADARQLTDNADANLQINSPLWSPDGSRVAFAARTRAQTAADKPQNRVYAVENGQSKIVWQTDSQIRLLGWSATGAEIFVAAKEAEEIAVFKIPVGEGEKKTIRPAARLPGASLHAVRLSPDRRQLAFVARNGDGRDNIFQVSAEPGGGEIRQLTANLDPTLYYSGLAWSPDGRKLFYSKQTGGLQISLITNPK